MSQNNYARPLFSVGTALVNAHNNQALAGNDGYIVTYEPKPDIPALNFFQTAPVADIRDILNATFMTKPEQSGVFALFHAVRPGDDVVHTNSKLPSLHIHAFKSGFAEGYTHIAGMRTYVPHPKLGADETVQEMVARTPCNDFLSVALPRDAREAAIHHILAHPGYSGAKNFADKAPDDVIDQWRDNMVSIIEPLVQPGMGGARIVIDERYRRVPIEGRYRSTTAFTVHVLGGENLAQDGGSRYFERPATAPRKAL